MKRAGWAVIGGALLVRGLKDRSVRGIAMGIAGGYLLSRSLGRGPRVERARTGSQRWDDTRSRTAADTATISRSITIGKPADELYDAWRDPEQLSQIMGHIGEITEAGEDRLRWTVRGPRGREYSWKTQIVEEVPGESLRWRTSEDAVLPNEGSVRFQEAPGGRGTQVTLSLSFDPPGGSLGETALTRLGIVPETLAGEALNRFKRLVETDEIPTLEGNPSARGKGDIV